MAALARQFAFSALSQQSEMPKTLAQSVEPLMPVHINAVNRSGSAIANGVVESLFQPVAGTPRHGTKHYWLKAPGKLRTEI